MGNPIYGVLAFFKWNDTLSAHHHQLQLRRTDHYSKKEAIFASLRIVINSRRLASIFHYFCSTAAKQHMNTSLRRQLKENPKQANSKTIFTLIFQSMPLYWTKIQCAVPSVQYLIIRFSSIFFFILCPQKTQRKCCLKNLSWLSLVYYTMSILCMHHISFIILWRLKLSLYN